MPEEKINILLVDDRPENLLALEAALGELGQNLVRATSGNEALRYLLQHDYAVILLDVQMPGMDGFETAAMIRENDRFHHTPIIFLTAIGKSEPEIFKGYAVGAVDYIFKPFVAEILRAKVRVFVDLYKMSHQIEAQAAELEAKNRLMSAVNKEMESFSYSISHDLRAPLRGIDGFSRALEEDYAALLDDQAKGYLRRIRTATVNMNQMIEGLLDLARLSRGDLISGNVRLSEMAHELAEQCQQNDPQRQVAWSITKGITVTGDSRLLRSALQNLIDNAWKYSSKTAQAKIEFGVTDEDGERVFYVRDNGVGFEPSLAKKLFVPFQRLHDSKEFSGMGLGLATVQRVIARHGGRVWVEAAEGKGATFYFTLAE